MASPSLKKSNSSKTLKTPSKKEARGSSTSPKSSPNRNLSDIAKRVRECCANWHENIHRWSKLNELGTSVANKVVNLQLQKEYHVVGETAVNEQDTTFMLQEEIAKASEELSRIYSSLADVLTKMEALVQSFNAVKNLQTMKKKEENIGPDHNHIFNTWTIEEFCNASQRLFDSFKKELSLKERLVPEFIRCKNRDDLMVYLSLWLHEPMLDDDNEILLESMLIEAELR